MIVVRCWCSLLRGYLLVSDCCVLIVLIVCCLFGRLCFLFCFLLVCCLLFVSMVKLFGIHCLLFVRRSLWFFVIWVFVGWTCVCGCVWLRCVCCVLCLVLGHGCCLMCFVG